MGDYNISKAKTANRNLDIFIGNKVKFRRTMLGISQDRLGSALGITFQQVQKYEKGVNRISASTLYNISSVLGCDFSYWIEGYEDNNSVHDDSTPTYEFDSSKKKETAELLRAYYKISEPALRKRILDFIRGMSSTMKKVEEKNF